MSEWFRNPVCCAIDRADLDGALAIGRELAEIVGGFKLGLEFFTANGPAGVAAMRELGAPIFLDLKLHDIPAVVAGAIEALHPLDIAMLTVHASGGVSMLKSARAAADALPNPPKLFAVTVLTSLGEDDLFSLGLTWRSPEAHALRLAELATIAGLEGLVCSPLEAGRLRKAMGPDTLLVTPGVRPADYEPDDQKRIATPERAIAAGANLLVVGRPITHSNDRAAAARRIVDAVRER